MEQHKSWPTVSGSRKNSTKLGRFHHISLSNLTSLVRMVVPCLLITRAAIQMHPTPRLFKDTTALLRSQASFTTLLLSSFSPNKVPSFLTISLTEATTFIGGRGKYSAMAALRILPGTTLAILFYILFYVVADTAVATDAPDYLVQGRVYCDTCRAGFETNVTEYIKGAKVKLECKHFGTGNVERTINGVTDETGTYKIELKDSHVEDICEVVLVESPLANCGEVQATRDRARVVLTRDDGICDNLRLANPLGYFKDVPLPVCSELLKQFDLADDDE